jgi:hypothetical protein
MVVRVVACGQNFQYFHPVIYAWHWLRSVPMMNGDAVGHKSCNIALRVMETLMAMPLETYY